MRHPVSTPGCVEQHLGGTIFASALGILFVPLFYVLIRRRFASRRDAALPAPPGPDPEIRGAKEGP